MTPEQSRCVRDSWRSLSAKRDEVVRDFYTRLFQLAPSLRALFGDDLSEQRRKLAITLNLAVSHIGQLDEIRDSLHELGRRHVHYGARPEHYELVIQALIWSLASNSGARFDANTEAAWRSALENISQAMLTGARGR